MKMVELIKKLNETKMKRDLFKAELLNTETKAYNAWKVENPKDRSAYDKVVSQLKADDYEWQQLEKEYNRTLIEYSSLYNVYNIVVEMLHSGHFDKKDIETFINKIEIV